MSKHTVVSRAFHVMGTTVRFPGRQTIRRAAVASFPARSSALSRLLGNARLRPAHLLPGRALVVVSWFEWADTPVGPFSQLTFAIPTLRDTPVALPGVALLAHAVAGREGKLGFLTHVVACSNEIGAAYSWEIWGEPSFVTEFEVEDGPEGVVVAARGPDGPAARLEVARRGRRVHDTKCYPMYTCPDGRVLEDCMKVDGKGLMRFLPGGARVRFGDDPRLAGLAATVTGESSLQSGVFESGQAVFFGPRACDGLRL